MNRSALLAELQACAQAISQVVARIERVASSLQETAEEEAVAHKPVEDFASAVSSRIHRETPPVIPADLASTLSRASNYGGERLRPQTVETPPMANYTDWASTLSRVSSVARGGDGLSWKR